MGEFILLVLSSLSLLHIFLGTLFAFKWPILLKSPINLDARLLRGLLVQNFWKPGHSLPLFTLTLPKSGQYQHFVLLFQYEILPI
jgi:hypothetical protein